MTTNQSIVACGQTADIGTTVVLWHHSRATPAPTPEDEATVRNTIRN